MRSNSDMILISSRKNFTDKVMPPFSCDDIDDGLQNQAQVAKSLDTSVTLYFKVKKNADHHDTQ